MRRKRISQIVRCVAAVDIQTERILLELLLWACMTYYQHYRLSTVGICLEEALEELKEKNIFTEAEVDMIRTKFDRAMAECLSSNCVNKHLTLKVSCC